jgi:hypothetical protein
MESDDVVLDEVEHTDLVDAALIYAEEEVDHILHLCAEAILTGSLAMLDAYYADSERIKAEYH